MRIAFSVSPCLCGESFAAFLRALRVLRGEIGSTGHWLLKYLSNCRIHLHCPLPGVTLIQNGAEPHSICGLSLPARRGRPVVLGGNMELRTCDHLKEDGVYCNSPALRGRDYCYFHLNLRGRRLNRAGLAHNSLWLNILLTTPASSIFCRDFLLSPPMFSIFYEPRERGRGVPLTAAKWQSGATPVTFVTSRCRFRVTRPASKRYP